MMASIEWNVALIEQDLVSCGQTLFFAQGRYRFQPGAYTESDNAPVRKIGSGYARLTKIVLLAVQVLLRLRIATLSVNVHMKTKPKRFKTKNKQFINRRTP